MSIIDVQKRADSRNIAINQVGIKEVRYPICLQLQDGSVQTTIATYMMTVGLSPEVKGTHMSRFMELIHNHQQRALSILSFKQLLTNMLHLLEANYGHIKIDFPLFLKKQAPISKVESLMDYQVSFIGLIDNNKPQVDIKLLVPVTSLCPCSKEISEYSAHNQRSHITLTIRVDENVALEEFIVLLEKQASCDLYGILKRSDEKYVTERAYENPKFVEDVVRDIALLLDNDQRIRYYKIESENFESIHNHSAYAMIEREK